MDSGLFDAALDLVLDERVRLHRDRAAGGLPVDAYLDGLRRVREQEDRLEGERRQLGARCSRAFELVAERDDEIGARARAYIRKAAS